MMQLVSFFDWFNFELQGVSKMDFFASKTTVQDWEWEDCDAAAALLGQGV